VIRNKRSQLLKFTLKTENLPIYPTLEVSAFREGLACPDVQWFLPMRSDNEPQEGQMWHKGGCPQDILELEK